VKKGTPQALCPDEKGDPGVSRGCGEKESNRKGLELPGGKRKGTEKKKKGKAETRRGASSVGEEKKKDPSKKSDVLKQGKKNISFSSA